MGLIDKLKDSFRKELPVKEDILKREAEFQSRDPKRLQWVLDKTYLTDGDLDDLKKHPLFDAKAQGIDYIIAHYVSAEGNHDGTPAKAVVIRVEGDIKTDLYSVENTLKFNLHTRGCNAGVFYKVRQDGKYIIAEATPAMITGE